MHETANGKKTFCIDIDGVIMKIVPDNDYAKSSPYMDVVSNINMLYDQGHCIILFTARGYVTKIDWHDVTVKQMRDCGLKYHELHFGKPAADYYIDDRNASVDILKSLANNNTSL